MRFTFLGGEQRQTIFDGEGNILYYLGNPWSIGYTENISHNVNSVGQSVSVCLSGTYFYVMAIVLLSVLLNVDVIVVMLGIHLFGIKSWLQ